MFMVSCRRRFVYVRSAWLRLQPGCKSHCSAPCSSYLNEGNRIGLRTDWLALASLTRMAGAQRGLLGFCTGATTRLIGCRGGIMYP